MQISQENTCVGACSFIEKRLQHRCFPINFGQTGRYIEPTKASPVGAKRKHFKYFCLQILFLLFLDFLLKHFQILKCRLRNTLLRRWFLKNSFKLKICVAINLWELPSNQSEKISVDIYLLKVNKRNTRTKCETCSKLTIKTS